MRVQLALLALAVSLLGAGLLVAPASAAPSTYTIALITSLSGPGASQFSKAPAGFKARIALQNAKGGVHGHKLRGIVLDDQTSPTQVVTAVQVALSKGAIGIVSDSPLFFAAAKYPEQRGVPVTGGFFDGPEWGQQPYTNMFASDNGSVDPKYPVNTQIGDFMKSHGGTRICSYGYGISPSSTRAALAAVLSFKHAGGKQGVLDASIPFGSVDMTTPALVAKQKHCDAFFAGLDNNSNFALATALRHSGVKPKVTVFPTGYEPKVIGSSVWRDVQGGYFDTVFRPFQLPNAGTRQMAAALQRYQHFGSNEFPDYSQYESWLGADLMIKGLQRAGKNADSASVIKALRHLKHYNGHGLLPVTINYSKIFGHDPPKSCAWYMQAKEKGFAPVRAEPFCGRDLQGTTTVRS